MSEQSKMARAAMKAKAKRMASGDPGAKVDASSWSPPEGLNADKQTGLRPVSPRQFKRGGKLKGKAAAMRADRKPRKSGGAAMAEKNEVNDKINRNVKEANAEKFGKPHEGGMKRGGKAKRPGKAFGGPMMGAGAGMAPRPAMAAPGGMGGYGAPRAPIAGTSAAEMGNNAIPVAPQMPAAPVPQAPAGPQYSPYMQQMLAQQQARPPMQPPTSPPPTFPPPSGLQSASPLSQQQMIQAVANQAPPNAQAMSQQQQLGQMLSQLPPGVLAQIQQRMGQMHPPSPYGSQGMLQGLGGQGTFGGNTALSVPRKSGGGVNSKGGSNYLAGTRPTGGRIARASGGKTGGKGKTNIIIAVNPGGSMGGDPMQAQAPRQQMQVPVPAPPQGVPMQMPAGPPPGPPPGAGAPPPAQMMPRKSGGRALANSLPKKSAGSYKDMTAGSLGGIGKLQKASIAEKQGRKLGGPQ